MPDPDKVYDVLVREAMAEESGRHNFRSYVNRREPMWHLMTFETPGLAYNFKTRRMEPTKCIPGAVKRVMVRTNAALAALEGGDAD